jgi:8-amino-7-oxononanoate synthase
MSGEFHSKLQEKLEARDRLGILRNLKNFITPIDFSSNDYLGLGRSEELYKLIKQKVEKLPLKNGSTGSRLLTGNSVYAEEVEHKLSAIFRSEAALVFNSGYNANLGILSSVPQRGDTILYDEYAHASIKDGARLSLAKRIAFRHNDVGDLERKLKKVRGHAFIIVESVYSMDGDECPLADLVELSESYESSIVLDEAHSTGVMGEAGSGLAVSLGLQGNIAIRIYTFGKAMGVHGACVAGSRKLIDYLVNFSRPFVYTTSLSPHSFASIDCSFEFLKSNTYLQQNLRENINLFKSGFHGKNLKSNSAIQAVVIPGNAEVKEAATQLQSAGLDVRPILYPTIPRDTERLRFCIHAFNTEHEINHLVKNLNGLTPAIVN